MSNYWKQHGGMRMALGGGRGGEREMDQQSVQSHLLTPNMGGSGMSTMSGGSGKDNSSSLPYSSPFNFQEDANGILITDSQSALSSSSSSSSSPPTDDISQLNLYLTLLESRYHSMQKENEKPLNSIKLLEKSSSSSSSSSSSASSAPTSKLMRTSSVVKGNIHLSATPPSLSRPQTIVRQKSHSRSPSFSPSIDQSNQNISNPINNIDPPPTSPIDSFHYHDIAARLSESHHLLVQHHQSIIQYQKSMEAKDEMLMEMMVQSYKSLRQRDKMIVTMMNMLNESEDLSKKYLKGMYNPKDYRVNNPNDHNNAENTPSDHSNSTPSSSSSSSIDVNLMYWKMKGIVGGGKGGNHQISNEGNLSGRGHRTYSTTSHGRE